MVLIKYVGQKHLSWQVQMADIQDNMNWYRKVINKPLVTFSNIILHFNIE